MRHCLTSRWLFAVHKLGPSDIDTGDLDVDAAKYSILSWNAGRMNNTPACGGVQMEKAALLQKSFHIQCCTFTEKCKSTQLPLNEVQLNLPLPPS
jgi:hypothetical protein